MKPTRSLIRKMEAVFEDAERFLNVGGVLGLICVLLLFIPNTVVRGFVCGALGFYWIFGILVCSNWADAKREVIDFLLYHVVADPEAVLPRWELYMAYCRSVVPVVEDSKTVGFCRKVVSERKFYVYVNEASNVFFPHMEIYQDFFKGICLQNSAQLFLDSQS